MTVDNLSDSPTPTVEELQATIRTLTRENAVLKSEKNRVGLSFRRVPESGSHIQALRDERFPYLEHVPNLSYTLSDRRRDDAEVGREPSQPTDGNVTLIEAENLAALTALQLTHRGKVDVIYIDPPYNTGSKDFVYNDARTSKLSDVTDAEGNRLSIEDYELTLDGNVRSVGKDDPERHSLWLSFMEKRLWLAKHLLSDEGVIFISIDDNEQARLKVLMDSIYGEQNFITCISASYNPRGRSISRFFANNHEYIMVYVKDIDKTKLNPKLKSLVNTEDYPMEDEVGNYREMALLNANRRFKPENLPNLAYPLYVNPDTMQVSLERSSEADETVYPAFSDGSRGVWRWGKEKVQEGLSLLFGKRRPNGEMSVGVKDYVTEDTRKALKTQLDSSTLGSVINSKKELARIISDGEFDYPKHVKTPKLLAQMIDKKDATVLDFFAGSGTTGHAIAELNAEDGGSRHCILVTHGDENGKNIAEDITALRLKRVLSGKDWADGKSHDPLPGELTYYRLDFTPPFKSELETTGELQGKFAGYVALEQGVTLAPVQPDLEGLTLLSSLRRNVLLMEDDFLLGTPELDDALTQLYDPERENILYLPVEEAEAYCPDSGWLLNSCPADYLRSHLSLLMLMKNNKTLLPLPGTSKG